MPESSEPTPPERFIPLRRSAVVALCHDRILTHRGATEAAQFQQAAELIQALYHHDFHARLERMKELYAPFNPDLDKRLVGALDDEERTRRHAALTEELQAVVEAANFERITKADLQAALTEESLFRIRLDVDFEDFSHVVFYRRGESTRTESLPTWFGLSSRPITFQNFDQVVVFVTWKDAPRADGSRSLPPGLEPASTMVKLFRDVPRADLEMLFPNTRVAMKLQDKLALGVPAAVSGVVLLTTKLGPTLLLLASLLSFWAGAHNEPVVLDQAALLALGAGLGTLGGFFFQQFTKFKNRKIQFMKTLSESLYFRNLDNNEGVFHRLIDAAEEEECKEALLAWTWLVTTAEPLDDTALDGAIEAALEEPCGGPVDFEIDDALRKLTELGLVSRREDGGLEAVGPDEARHLLDARWDALYAFD